MSTNKLTRVNGIKCIASKMSDDDIHKNCALRGYYAASSGNFLLTFRHNLSVPSQKRAVLMHFAA